MKKCNCCEYENTHNIKCECCHDFKFSHIEYPTAGTYSNIPPNKEVVICTKCGEMRKTIIYS